MVTAFALALIAVPAFAPFISMKNIPRLFVPVVAALLLLAVAGCAPRNPYESQIKATTPEQLNSWLMFNTRPLKNDEVAEMNECLGEIKIHLRTTSATNLEERLCSELNGKPLKWVFTEGYRLRFERLKAEREIYVEDLKYKESLRTKLGDTASEDYLEQQKKMRREQVADFTDRINKTATRYLELLKKSGPSEPDAGTPKTP